MSGSTKMCLGIIHILEKNMEQGQRQTRTKNKRQVILLYCIQQGPKGWRIQQRDFFKLNKKKKKIRHISRKKKLKLARFRQCVLLGRQN
jgi:hypothetical protein